MPLLCTLHVAGRGNLFMADLAALFGAGLEDLGIRSRVAVDEIPEGGDGHVDVIVAPHEWFVLGPSLVPDDRFEIVSRSAVLTTEQPGTQWFDLGLPWVKAAAAAFDLNRRAVDALSAHRRDVVHTPVGYHRSIDRWGGVDDGPRPLAATFLGGATERRLSLLAGLAPVLGHRDSRLLLHDPRRPVTNEHEWFVAGERRPELLAASKVLVNLHRGEEPYFEWVRAIEAVANGAVLLSEPSSGHEPLEPFVDFVVADGANLAAHLEALIVDDDTRDRIAASAYERARCELDLVKLLKPLVDVLDDVATRTARPVTRLPEPAPPPQRPRPAPPADEHTRTLGVLKRVLTEQIALERRLDALDALVGRRVDAVEERATPGWHRATPDVSVIVPAFRYAASVIQAVESALASTGVAVEVVIVEDHSRDATRPVIEAFLDTHPDAPVAALFRSSNRGLGAARNLGFEHARASRCFLLDADNLVRPDALRKLAAALDGSDAAFAYSIIEVFGDEETLLSFLPWSVASLVVENFIDAMALIRRSTWEAVGGFREATEASIYGWEDYDFWLSVADLGLRGTWVPEPLCRYRRHRASMLTISNLDPVTPMLYLRESHPRLPWPS